MFSVRRSRGKGVRRILRQGLARGRGPQGRVPVALRGGVQSASKLKPASSTARQADRLPTLGVMVGKALAASLKVAIPTSFFERDGHHYYNTMAMIGPDGEIMGTYRKSHIPDGPGYEEKYYFRPGNDGFKVWDLFGHKLGVGICWDQWYPEAARVMALMGAEVLLYPTAIGTEPYDADLDTSRMWRRAMQGHAVSNCMPVIAANRIGSESMDGTASQRFYGHSFIANQWGDFLADYGAEETGVLVATLDLAEAARHRAGMGFFRDRRPQLYTRLAEDI